jgi:hypothetical protein
VFTNEFETDSTVTTIIDEEAQFEDVQFIVNEYGDVIVRQWNERQQGHDVVLMSATMFGELLGALNKPEGAYRLNIKKRKPKEKEEEC